MPLVTGVGRVVQILQKLIVAAGGSTGRELTITSHWRRTATTPPFNKQNVLTAFGAQVSSNIMTGLNVRVSNPFNMCRSLMDGTDAFVRQTTADVGAITGDGMPIKTTMFILMLSGLRGKAYNGGMYIGGLSESDTTTPNADVLNAAAITRWNAIAAQILAGFTDSDGNVWVPTIFSRGQSAIKVNSTIKVFVSDVQSIAVNHRLSSMAVRRVPSVY